MSAKTVAIAKGVAGVGLAVTGAALLWILLTGGNGGYEFTVTVPKATGVLAGQDIRSAGAPVGTVKKVEPVQGGRAARLTLSLDEKAWPVTKGSTFTVRWGGTINLFNRYIDYKRASDGPSIVKKNGQLPVAAFKVPVEYGDLLSVFDKDTRADLKQLLDRGGLALDSAGPRLRSALRVAPGPVHEADKVLSDLDESRSDLETLVLSTGHVVNSIQRSDPGLRELVVGAGTTLEATADSAAGLQGTLDEAPGTFRRATATLRRADTTLIEARSLARELEPGVKELRKIVPPLNSVLQDLASIGPNAEQTLQVAGQAAPDLTRLIKRADTLSPQLRSISKQADFALNCIRPYTPEIVSLGSLWASALAGHDGNGNRYIRAQPEAFIPAPHNAQYENSAQVIAKNPGLTYAFPRPPGTQAGQPWFLPECGAGPDAFDPSKDPEARKFDPSSQFVSPPQTDSLLRKAGRK